MSGQCKKNLVNKYYTPKTMYAYKNYTRDVFG